MRSALRASDDGRRRPGRRVLKRRGRDIAATVDATQTTVLQVLRLRRASGVVANRRDSRIVTYRVADAHLRMLLDRRAGMRATRRLADGRAGPRSGRACRRTLSTTAHRRIRPDGHLLIVELVAGPLSGSLALVADAGHLATDIVALGASLVATRIAVRKDTTGRRSFGSYRAEVFASGLAVLMMLGVGVLVVVEAIRRIGEDPSSPRRRCSVVGAVGLAVNLVTLALLRSGAGDSLNVKGAYLEVFGDAVGQWVSSLRPR